MENNSGHAMKSLMVIFFVLTTGLSAQTMTDSVAIDTSVFKVKHWVDSVYTQVATWKNDSVLVKGDPKCNHNWLTEFEGVQYENAPDSLRAILNPNNQRWVQEICLICGREHFKLEQIKFVWKKKRYN